MVTNYGAVIDTIHYKNKVYIVCEKDLIYSLIVHDKVFDVTDVLIRCSDIQYIEFLIKEKMKNEI